MQFSVTNSFIVYIFTFLGYSDPWVKANTLNPVCFGARDNKYGSFRVPKTGKIAAVKLIHLSGYVSCSGQINEWSFWGCGYHRSLTDHVSVVITTSSNTLLMPPNQFFTLPGDTGKWARLPGQNSFSPEIILPRFSPYSTSHGQELRLWYGEDLVAHTESDNGGWVCCDVYVLYV